MSLVSSGSGGEVLVLSVGTYSNYTATHFFNLQHPELVSDDVDSNIYWTRGRISTGRLDYVPRLIAIDLKDNLVPTIIKQDTSKVKNGAIESSSLWDGTTQVVQVDGPRRPALSNESPANTWLDAANWSPNTTIESSFGISALMRNEQVRSIENYSHGIQCYEKIEEGLSDSIRRYVEPCDFFQGFQILADQDDGFGGIASCISTHLKDEYERKNLICFGLTRPTFKSLTTEEGLGMRLKLANTALTWNGFYNHSTLFTSLGLTSSLYSQVARPVSVPFMSYKADSDYESSFFLGATLDSLTSPCRLKSGRVPYSDITTLLGSFGHKMTAVSSAFPYSIPSNSSFVECLQKDGLQKLVSLLPGTTVDTSKCIANYFTVRGVREDEVIRRDKLSNEQLYKLKDVKDVVSCLEAYCTEISARSVNVVCQGVKEFHVRKPFGQLVDQAALKNLATTVSQSQGVYHLRGIASAHNCPAVGDLLRNFLEAESKPQGGFVSSRSSASCIADVEQDDYNECIHNLGQLRDSYDMNLS